MRDAGEEDGGVARVAGRSRGVSSAVRERAAGVWESDGDQVRGGGGGIRGEGVAGADADAVARVFARESGR